MRQSPKLPQIVPGGGHEAHVAPPGSHGDGPCNGAEALALATVALQTISAGPHTIKPPGGRRVLGTQGLQEVHLLLAVTQKG